MGARSHDYWANILRIFLHVFFISSIYADLALRFIDASTYQLQQYKMDKKDVRVCGLKFA